MKLKKTQKIKSQPTIAAGGHIDNENYSAGNNISPPPIQLSSDPTQFKNPDSENNSFQDYNKYSYAYNPGSSHLKEVKRLLEMNELNVYLEINKLKDTSEVYKLILAINQISNPNKKDQKKLKDIKLMLQSRKNTLSALSEQDASEEKIEGTKEKNIDKSWTKVGSSIHFKHVEAKGLLSNTRLTTKIRNVREKSSEHNWGSTGYDLFIPFSINKGKHWYPIILDPVMYIDVDVGEKKDFSDLKAFKPFYEEYQELISKYKGDKEQALKVFAEKHTKRGVTTDLPLPQEATIYHEAGHVKEFQTNYADLMSNFIPSVNERMSQYEGTNPVGHFLDFADQMWRAFDSDMEDRTHTKIVFNEIKAMIALYEGKGLTHAFNEHDAFSQIREKINDK